MKNIFLLLLLSMNFYVVAQTSKSNKVSFTISEDSIIKKWTRATINIAVYPRNDKAVYRLRATLDRKYGYNWSMGAYDSFIVQQAILKDSAQAFALGTAILFADSGRYYLITARHVLEDTTSEYRCSIFKNIVLVKNPTSEALITSYYKNGTTRSMATNGIENLDFSTEAGYLNAPYIYADNDLAILDITMEGGNAFSNSYFASRLIQLGYEPININDISLDKNLPQDRKIKAIGFPNESQMQYIDIPSELQPLEFGLRTLPIIAEGTIGKVDTSAFFHPNVFSYHGDSGGPMIYGNKLVGICSSGGWVPQALNTKKLNYYLMWQTNFIKSYLIIDQLRSLQAKVRKIEKELHSVK